MTDLRDRLHAELVGSINTAALDATIAANLDRWITEAVADTTPLDQLDPLHAEITEALRRLAP